MAQQDEPNYAKDLGALRALSDKALVDVHDKVSEQGAVVDVEYYLAELARRDAGRREKQMLALTGQMLTLTRVVAGLTALNAVFVAVTVVRTLW